MFRADICPKPAHFTALKCPNYFYTTTKLSTIHCAFISAQYRANHETKCNSDEDTHT